MAAPLRLLVVNCGSATLKWKLFRWATDVQAVLASGAVPVRAEGYREAVRCALKALPAPPEAIAHRVVHGGELPGAAVVVDASVLQRLRELTVLAPLHNAPALE